MPNGDLQGDAGVADGDAMPHAHVLGDLLLEFLHERPVIAEPIAVGYFAQPGEEPLAVAWLDLPTCRGSSNAGSPPKIAKSSLWCSINMAPLISPQAGGGQEQCRAFFG